MAVLWAVPQEWVDLHVWEDSAGWAAEVGWTIPTQNPIWGHLAVDVQVVDLVVGVALGEGKWSVLPLAFSWLL